jgi:ribose transport system substrate-binding protein
LNSFAWGKKKKEIVFIPPGIKIVAYQPGDWERKKSMNVATNLLQVKDIDVFYGLSDEMALGASQAYKAAGITDIIIIGIDGNPNTFVSIEKGDVTATLGVNPDTTGEEAIKAAEKRLREKAHLKKS